MSDPRSELRNKLQRMVAAWDDATLGPAWVTHAAAAMREAVAILEIWQPITTHPASDMNPVLLWWPFWTQTPVIGEYWDGVWSTEKWLGDDATDPGPTHWMPLPEPPPAD
jgi:hypothetical protein